jgi:hypothetical protein
LGTTAVIEADPDRSAEAHHCHLDPDLFATPHLRQGYIPPNMMACTG